MSGKPIFVAGVFVMTLGCGWGSATVANPTGKGGIVRMKDRARVPQMLEQIGVAYRLCCLDGKPPNNANELLPNLDNSADYAKLLKDGNVIVIWGVRLDTAPGQAILAYEKDADEHATRYVLLAGGSVKGMTEQEFQAAPKAKGN